MKADGNSKTIIQRLEDEFRATSVYEPSVQLELLKYAKKLEEKPDPNWVDLMVWRLTKENLPLPVTVQILASRVAHIRLLGGGSRNKVSKVFKEHTRELAMTVMASRIKPDGVGKAAQFASKTVYAVCGHAPAPSTLESEFPNYVWPTSQFLGEFEKLKFVGSTEQQATLKKEVAKLNDRAGTRR